MKDIKSENKLFNGPLNSKGKNPSIDCAQNSKSNNFSKNVTISRTFEGSELGNHLLKVPKVEENKNFDHALSDLCSQDVKESLKNSVGCKSLKFECVEDCKHTEIGFNNENGATECKTKVELDNIPHNRNKRSSTTSGSPFKDKKRKKLLEDASLSQTKPAMNLISINQTSNMNQMILDSSETLNQKPIITKIYYSYFERTSDDNDDIKEMK